MADMLTLDVVRMDGGTQARETLDMVVISEYAEALKNGDQFPAVVVYFDGSDYWLADGFHRVRAAERAGLVAIEADVHQGGQRDALLHAVGANDTHGLRRSNADKRKAVLTLLHDEEWQKWSDSEMARRTKTSPPFVTKIRATHLQTFKDSGAGEQRKVQRGGKTYTMETGRIGTTKTAAAEKPTPAAPGKDTQGDGDTAQAAPAPPPTQTPGSEAAVPAAALAVAEAPEKHALVEPRPAEPEVAPDHVAPQEVPAEHENTPYLAIAWEQASGEERQAFVKLYRTELFALLEILEPPAFDLPADMQPSSQPGIILQGLFSAGKPLAPEDLQALSSINKRVLGRNLTRLCASNRIEKDASGRYTPVTVRATSR